MSKTAFAGLSRDQLAALQEQVVKLAIKLGRVLLYSVTALLVAAGFGVTTPQTTKTDTRISAVEIRVDSLRTSAEEMRRNLEFLVRRTCFGIPLQQRRDYSECDPYRE